MVHYRAAKRNRAEVAGMTFSLNLQDVEDYLDSKQPDEVVGITCEASRCLVAEAFKMKYPECGVIVDSTGISVWHPLSARWGDIGVEPGVRALVRQFDTIDADERPVTKREWEEGRA